MPRKTFRRKRRIRRTRRRKMTNQLNVPMTGFPPNSTRVLQTYEDIKVYDPIGGGNFAFNKYSCNGAYDPDITGGGHQPRGWDQLMALYHRFRVISSRITARVVSNPNVPCYLTLSRISDTSTPVTLNDLVEYSPLKKSFCNVGLDQNRQISMGFRGVKHYGRKYLMDDIFSGTDTTNPSEQTFFLVGLYSSDQATDLTGTSVETQVTYVIEFWEPKIVGQS